MSAHEERSCSSTRRGGDRDRRQVRGAPRRHPAAPRVLLLRPRRAGPAAGDPAGRAQARPSAASGPTPRCGHPAPGEPIGDAVRRRVGQELGLTLDDLWLVLPPFRYRAEMDGVVENEMCPVFVATTMDAVRLDPEEVDDHEWVDWPTFRDERPRRHAATSARWCVEQVTQLPEDLAGAPAADPMGLPAAARG